VVAPASKWKEKGHVIEVIMAGCSPTPCSPNLHVESGADVEERFLVIRWMMDLQSGNSEISQSLEITRRHDAGAGTRQAMKRRITEDSELANTSHAGGRSRESQNRRITQESELANLQTQSIRRAFRQIRMAGGVGGGG